MPAGLVRHKYAKVLLDLCHDADCHDKILALRSVFFAFNARLGTLSRISDSVLLSWLKSGGVAIEGKLANFLLLVRNRGRLPIILDIIDSYMDMRANIRGEARVLLCSGFTMNEELLAEISSRVGKKMGCTLDVQCKTDDNIVGGFIVYGRSCMVDCTLIGRLHALADSMADKLSALEA